MTTVVVLDRIDELFDDARAVHAQAVERLEHGDIRDAAEKAWCATKRATDALILTLTYVSPEPRHEPPMSWTTWPTGNLRPNRSKPAITAGSASFTGLASTTGGATGIRSVASRRLRNTSPMLKPWPADNAFRIPPSFAGSVFCCPG